MKKITILLCMILVVVSSAFADTLTLNTAETISDVPANVSQKLDWEVRLRKGVCTVEFRWLDSNNREIGPMRSFHCIDHSISNGDCTARGVPQECCTALDAGVCDCWTDVFLFQVRSQDVGTSIGAGLRQLLYNQWKKVYLTGTNDGSFD